MSIEVDLRKQKSGPNIGGASFVITDEDATLPNARTITAGTGITITDNGPGEELIIESTGGGGGSGTVTSVSVVAANGFDATVATATTTPAITLLITESGVLKGDTGAIVPATDSDITDKLITGYVSSPGVVAATDSILEAIEKLNGNTDTLVIPDAATQIEVDAGVVADEYVSPLTLNAWATSGPGGQTAFFTWKYSTNTASADPGSGFFRGNNISAGSVTKLYIDDITSGNQVDISNLFERVKGQWLLHIQQRNDASKWMQFHTSLPYIDNTGWWTLDVTFQQEGGGGSLTNLTDCLFTFVNQNDTPSAQGDTGALTYGGMTAASTTTVNIGALTGWVVDNETDPNNPTQTYISYPGASNVTVPTIASGYISYLLMLPNGSGGATLVWQNTFPTSAQRKTHIYASKCSHPNLSTLGVIGNETDYITSPMGLTRDFFQSVNYVNNGIHATASSPGLTFATSAGKIVGDGINFYLSRTNPNEITRGASNPTSFFYRTQIGGATGAVTAIDPTMYDVAGTITAIPGSTNQATIQYIYAVPFNGAIGFVVQYGQTIYSTLAAAISNVGKENPVIFPNLIRDSILIGFLCVQKGCTDLTISTTAVFFKSDIFGQAAGGSGGTSVSTFQQAYNNSGVVDPQILTSTANDGVKIRRGSAADTDNVLVIQNGAGSSTFTVNGNGDIVSPQLTSPLDIGGTGAGSSKEIRATSGVGIGAEFIKITGGNNGGTEWGRFVGGNLGIGMTPVNILDITKNQNAGSHIKLLNSNSGSASYSDIMFSNGTHLAQFGLAGTGYTTYGIINAGNSFLLGSSNLAFIADGSSTQIKFGFGSITTPVLALNSSGNTGIFRDGGSTSSIVTVKASSDGSNSNSRFSAETPAGLINQFGIYSASKTAYGSITANASYIYSGGSRLTIMQDSDAPIIFCTGTGAPAAERWRISGGLGNLSNVGSDGTAYLHLKAGTATASTAPLKFTSGSLNTIAAVGAVEFLTDKVYFTITTSAARKEFTLNDAALTPTFLPIATTNGRISDSVFKAIDDNGTKSLVIPDAAGAVTADTSNGIRGQNAGWGMLGFNTGSSASFVLTTDGGLVSESYIYGEPTQIAIVSGGGSSLTLGSGVSSTIATHIRMNLATYANDTDAGVGGLVTGDLYQQTTTHFVMIKQ